MISINRRILLALLAIPSLYTIHTNAAMVEDSAQTFPLLVNKRTVFILIGGVHYPHAADPTEWYKVKEQIVKMEANLLKIMPDFSQYELYKRVHSNATYGVHYGETGHLDIAGYVAITRGIKNKTKDGRDSIDVSKREKSLQRPIFDEIEYGKDNFDNLVMMFFGKEIEKEVDGSFEPDELLFVTSEGEVINVSGEGHCLSEILNPPPPPEEERYGRARQRTTPVENRRESRSRSRSTSAVRDSETEVGTRSGKEVHLIHIKSGQIPENQYRGSLWHPRTSLSAGHNIRTHTIECPPGKLPDFCAKINERLEMEFEVWKSNIEQWRSVYAQTYTDRSVVFDLLDMLRYVKKEVETRGDSGNQPVSDTNFSQDLWQLSSNLLIPDANVIQGTLLRSADNLCNQYKVRSMNDWQRQLWNEVRGIFDGLEENVDKMNIIFRLGALCDQAMTNHDKQRGEGFLALQRLLRAYHYTPLEELDQDKLVRQVEGTLVHFGYRWNVSPWQVLSGSSAVVSTVIGGWRLYSHPHQDPTDYIPTIGALTSGIGFGVATTYLQTPTTVKESSVEL